jgi:DNA-binding SARP family transcriptional activator
LVTQFGAGDDATVLQSVPGARLDGELVVLPRRFEPSAPIDGALLADAAAVACEVLLETDLLEEAARVAIAGGAPDPLRRVVAAALRTQPPLVPAHVLRRWADAALLADDELHARWLRVTCDDIAGASPHEVLDRLLELREELEAAGAADAEISVGMAAAIAARRADDLGALLALIGRADQIVASGHPEAAGPGVLGRALVLQFGGRSEEALEALESFPTDRLRGDWAAQVAMVAGTNHLLLDRADEAIDHLEQATGLGGPWSAAVALELLATARWYAGDRIGALADLEASERLAVQLGASSTAATAAAHRAVLLAALGEPRAHVAAERARRYGATVEAAELLALSEALLDAGGDHETGRATASSLPLPARATRSAPWVVAFKVAFGVDGDEARKIEHLADQHPSLGKARELGLEAADALAAGRALPSSARRLLPARWCEPTPPAIELALLGGSVLHRDGVRVSGEGWERARVRELCVHLALRGDRSRRQVAATLWPDLAPAAAQRNLRVTLAYLTGLLEPERTRGGGSELIDERDDRLRFADHPRLRIDIRAALDAADALSSAAALGNAPAMVIASRQLTRWSIGPLLGGACDAAWIEEEEARVRSALLAAASAGAPIVLRAGDPDLATSLAELGLSLDPWAERLHQVVVNACIARGDLDAARRALRRSLAALAELDISPEPTTLGLATRLGVN